MDVTPAHAHVAALASRKTILLADDDEALSLLWRHALRKAQVDAHLHVVTNGITLVSYLRGEDLYQDRSRFPYPSLVLLDLEMPCLGGIGVLEAMRQQQLPPAPMLIFSSLAPAAVVDRCYELGCRFYIQKPTRFDDLVQLAREIGRWWIAGDGAPEDWSARWLVRRARRSIASTLFPTPRPSCPIESQ